MLPTTVESASEKENAVRQGIISPDGCTENCIKLRIATKDKSSSNDRDNAIANAYRDKPLSPSTLKMLDITLLPVRAWKPTML